MRLSRAIRISVVSLFRCAASRNKRAPTGCFIASLYPTFLFDVGGRSLRGPRQRQLRASAAGRRSTTHSSLVGSSASGECNELRRVAVRRWRRTARLYESHKLDSFVLGRAPRRPPSAFAALRGRRFLAESCYSLLAYSNSPPAGSATSPDELQSAAWGGGELRGSKSRKSSTPNSPQFSAPCPPHCGSAYAPPHSRRPLGFHLDFAHRKTSEIPLYAGGRRLFDGVDFFARRSDSSIFGYRRNS